MWNPLLVANCNPFPFRTFRSYLLKGKGCGPGSLDGMVSPQGGSVRAGVRLCGVGRVMVLERCRLSFRVRSRS